MNFLHVLVFFLVFNDNCVLACFSYLCMTAVPCTPHCSWILVQTPKSQEGDERCQENSQDNITSVRSCALVLMYSGAHVLWCSCMCSCAHVLVFAHVLWCSCVHVLMCSCLLMCSGAHVLMYAHVFMYAHVLVYSCACVLVCLCAHVLVCSCACVLMCSWACVSVHDTTCTISIQWNLS